MQGSYQFWLVVLSWLVAVLAAGMFLNIVRALPGFGAAHRLRWHLTGAAMMGLGIWAMHFIGMLAWHLPIEVSYDVIPTLVSILPASAGTWLTLTIMLRQHGRGAGLRGGPLWLAGLALGSGIGAMHYIGMSALQLTPPLRYHLDLLLLSVGLSVLLATSALRLTAHRIERLQHPLPGAMLLGSAVTAMHYTAMAAADIAPDAVCLSGSGTISAPWLGLLVAIGSVTLIVLTMLASTFDQRLAEQSRARIEELQQLNAQLEARATELAQQMTAELQRLVGELRNTQHEDTVLRETSDLLHLSENIDEAFDIIRLAALRLFPGWSGWVAAMRHGSELHIGAHWGKVLQHAGDHFEACACWGLRRGKIHLYLDATSSLCCHHLDKPADWPQKAYLCVPMAAHGESVGLLHFSADSDPDTVTLQAMQLRAERFAETLKLALSNLKLRSSLKQQAHHDGLTGLYNRRYLDDSLAAALRRARQDQGVVSLAMLDVDHFKAINDRWGHEAGDRVLEAIANVLKGQVRRDDLPCRYGGEEMAVIMPGCSLVHAVQRMEDIRRAVAALQQWFDGQPLPTVTISIGVTESYGEEAETVLRRADRALYRAKGLGRNRIIWNDDQDTSSAEDIAALLI